MGRGGACVTGSHPAWSGQVTVCDEHRRESTLAEEVQGKELGGRRTENEWR